MLKTTTLALAIALLITLSSCDQQSTQGTQKSENTHLKLDVENASWMRDKLPEKTLAYIRIPTFWNLFFEPSADSLHPALSHQNNLQQVEKLQDALIQTYISKVPATYQTHFKMLVKGIKTPVELAVTNATDGSMVPNVMIGTTLQDMNVSDLQDLMEAAVDDSQGVLKILKPLTDEGKASLLAQMIPIHVDFNKSNGRLAILSGPTATADLLQEYMNQSEAHASLSDIMKFEDSVDQSGKNQQAWINVKEIYQQNQGLIPPRDKQMMEQMGLTDIDFIWYGTAQHSGKGEMIFHIQMPETGLRKLLPRVDEHFDLETAGTPDMAFVLTLPTVEQVQAGYEFVKSVTPNMAQQDEKIQQGIDTLNQAIGMNVSDLLRAYGQQIYIVKDDAGLWFAQKIADKNKAEALYQQLNEKFNGTTASKNLAGVSVEETTFSLMELMNSFSRNVKSTQQLDELFYSNVKIYTQEQNGYVIWASVPQILADRSNSKNKGSLKDYLQGQLQLNWDQAILAWATESEYVSRDAYHKYLEMLSFMANVAKTDIDLFGFPTAQELGLPKKGRFGISVNSAPDHLSLRISYEHSLLESLSGSSGMMTVAVAGILAAIAVPAYHDYVIRAKVSEKMIYANSAKFYISEAMYMNQTVPSAEELEQHLGESKNYIYDESTGSLDLLFDDSSDSYLQNSYLTLTPDVDSEGMVYWYCESNLNLRQLPAVCKR